MSSFFAAATAAVWGTSTTPEPHDPSDVTAHINPKHATPEEIEKRVDALGTALASTEAPALLRKGGEPGLLPAAPDAECAIDRATLRRWLVAEKLDVASAASRLEKHAHWRADYVSIFCFVCLFCFLFFRRQLSFFFAVFLLALLSRRYILKKKIILLTISNRSTTIFTLAGSHGAHRTGTFRQLEKAREESEERTSHGQRRNLLLFFFRFFRKEETLVDKKKLQRSFSQTTSKLSPPTSFSFFYLPHLTTLSKHPKTTTTNNKRTPVRGRRGARARQGLHPAGARRVGQARRRHLGRQAPQERRRGGARAPQAVHLLGFRRRDRQGDGRERQRGRGRWWLCRRRCWS